MLWRTLGEHPWLCSLRTKVETRGALPEEMFNSRKIDFSAEREVFRAVSVGQTFLAQPKATGHTMAIPLAQGALSFFAGEYDKLQTLFLSRVVQPGTVLIVHDGLPCELVGWVLNISRWGV